MTRHERDHSSAPSELPVGYPWHPEWELGPCDVARRLSTHNGPLLLDCRTPDERRVASIAGSIHIPLGELEQRLDEVSDESPASIIVYCHHGVRSLRAVAILRAAGHTECWSMAGGIHAWTAAVDSTIPVY